MLPEFSTMSLVWEKKSPKKDLDTGAAEEDTVGLTEELDTFELAATVGVGVGVVEELGTLVVTPGGASKIASTQYDFSLVKPEQLGPMEGF